MITAITYFKDIEIGKQIKLLHNYQKSSCILIVNIYTYFCIQIYTYRLFCHYFCGEEISQNFIY